MARKASKRPAGKSPPTPGIIRKTFIIHSNVVESAMNAAFWERITLRELLERALKTEVARMEKANGGPFPKRSASVKRGRPLGH